MTRAVRPTRASIRCQPSEVATSVSPVTQGFEALIRAVLGQVCHSFTVESYCIPGSPQTWALSAIIRIRSRARNVSMIWPVRMARVCHSLSSITACMNSSVTRTELLEFWKKTEE